jgi:hypothetical protein
MKSFLQTMDRLKVVEEIVIIIAVLIVPHLHRTAEGAVLYHYRGLPYRALLLVAAERDLRRPTAIERNLSR